MKKIIVLSFMLLVLCSVSFAQSRKNERFEYQSSSARNLEPVQHMVVAPLIADLKPSTERISYTEKEAFVNYQLTESPDSNNIAIFSKIALSRAARAYNADVIIGAIIDIITNSNGYLEITVSGYPAIYTNFRNATKEDLEIVDSAILIAKDNRFANLVAKDSRTGNHGEKKNIAELKRKEEK